MLYHSLDSPTNNVYESAPPAPALCLYRSSSSLGTCPPRSFLHVPGLCSWGRAWPALQAGAFPLPPARSLCLLPASQLPQSSPDVQVPSISQIAVESFRNHSELVLPKMCKPRSYTKLGLQMLGGSSQLEEMFPHHNVQILFGGFSCTFKRET